MRVHTEGWKFPAPPSESTRNSALLPISHPAQEFETDNIERCDSEEPFLAAAPRRSRIRPKPTGETVLFKDRLMYLLQPPLDHLFVGKQVPVPFQPFPYQLEGIAFLMPRHAAMLADEMGLGKTAQAILAIRLLFQAGMVRRVLIVCPKALVFNWVRELQLWSPDMPFEVLGGTTESRRTAWTVSNTPVKLINYESLTRDADLHPRGRPEVRPRGVRRGAADQEPRLQDGAGRALDPARALLGADGARRSRTARTTW